MKLKMELHHSAAPRGIGAGHLDCDTTNFIFSSGNLLGSAFSSIFAIQDSLYYMLFIQSYVFWETDKWVQSVMITINHINFVVIWYIFRHDRF